MAWFSLKQNGYEVVLKLLRKTETPDDLEINQNPFEISPSFKHIWSNPDFQREAEEATADYLEHCSPDPKENDGSICVIFIQGKEFETLTPIGICGWYNVPSDKLGDYFIAHRWFGIVPEHRGKGLAKIAHTCLEFTMFNIVDAIYVTTFTDEIVTFWEELEYVEVEPNTPEWDMVKRADNSSPKHILKLV